MSSWEALIQGTVLTILRQQRHQQQQQFNLWPELLPNTFQQHHRHSLCARDNQSTRSSCFQIFALFLNEGNLSRPFFFFSSFPSEVLSLCVSFCLSVCISFFLFFCLLLLPAVGQEKQSANNIGMVLWACNLFPLQEQHEDLQQQQKKSSHSSYKWQMHVMDIERRESRFQRERRERERVEEEEEERGRKNLPLLFKIWKKNNFFEKVGNLGNSVFFSS